jgi:dTDP-4-amino-4,6-dideoxygalactose transaminase
VNSENRGVVLIEDASHALGSLYKGEKVGACAWSDMTVTSFHPVKHITTGEGGAVLTNDESLWRKLRRYRSHGITHQPEEFTHKERAFQRQRSGRGLVPHPWYYEQLDLGYNYRITDIQSALGLSQLKKMDPIRRRRSEIVKRYNEAFRYLEWLVTPHESPDCHTNFHLYIALFDFKTIGLGRSEVASRLRSKGIQTQVHYIPVNMQPYFENRFGTDRGDCPRAGDYYEKCLSLPLFPAMSDEEVERVIREIQALGPGTGR